MIINDFVVNGKCLFDDYDKIDIVRDEFEKVKSVWFGCGEDFRKNFNFKKLGNSEVTGICISMYNDEDDEIPALTIHIKDHK